MNIKMNMNMNIKYYIEILSNKTYMFLLYIVNNRILLHFFIVVLYLLFATEVVLCDDNTNTAVGGWGGELDGRSVALSNQKHIGNLGYDSTGRATWSYTVNDSVYNTQNYQPYDIGLHNTSHGYRHELSGHSAPVELDGRVVSGHYHDNYTQYSQPNSEFSDSTGYYQGGPYFVTENYSSTRRCLYNKIKRHLAKKNEEYLREREGTEKLMRDIRSSRNQANMHSQRRIKDMFNDTHKSVKVRRFD